MRDLTVEVQGQLESKVKAPIVFYEGEFDSGILRYWTGYGEIEWDGKTWIGAGNLASISAIQETTELKAVGMRVTLSGVPLANIQAVIAEAERGLPCRLWLGFLDENMQVIANPYKSFEGRLDQPEIDRGTETATIAINYESRLIDLERARERRYTDEDQKIDYPDDRGFEFVPRVQDWSERWGET